MAAASAHLRDKFTMSTEDEAELDIVTPAMFGNLRGFWAEYRIYRLDRQESGRDLERCGIIQGWERADSSWHCVTYTID